MGVEDSLYKYLFYDLIAGHHMYSHIKTFHETESKLRKIYCLLILLIGYPMFWYYIVKPRIRENERVRARTLMTRSKTYEDNK